MFYLSRTINFHLLNHHGQLIYEVESNQKFEESTKNNVYFYNYQHFKKKLSHLTSIEYRCQMAI